MRFQGEWKGGNEQNNQTQSTTQLRAGLLGLALLALITSTANAAPAIFQVNSKTYYGKTYGD